LKIIFKYHFDLIWFWDSEGFSSHTTCWKHVSLIYVFRTWSENCLYLESCGEALIRFLTKQSSIFSTWRNGSAKKGVSQFPASVLGLQ
jgi:hypothetical protein